MTPRELLEEKLRTNAAYDPDADPKMNPGIVRTVKWLRGLGFVTVDSGDGVTGLCECDLPLPYVHMYIPYACDLEAEAHKLKFQVQNLTSPSVWEREFKIPDAPEEPPYSPTIEATYSPIDGVTIISLMGINDELLFGNPSKN